MDSKLILAPKIATRIRPISIEPTEKRERLQENLSEINNCTKQS
uniref:Uncharacterized protein n=1 Tax=Nelumbo nucifera TaxID=4432 RepID=A0A822XYS6_NELNU|nr:TPA_asm: hypothetical protein HUJ06_025388 [Nelumbo nucifera]